MKKILFTLLLISFSLQVFAQNTSTTQMQLVNSSTFTNRLQYLLTQEAIVVLAEAHSTACHVQRFGFATQIIQNPAQMASQSSVMIAGSTNVVGTVVTNVDPNKVDSSATDAALFSQIVSLWNALSKCDTGS